MAKTRTRWGKPVLLGIALLYTGIRLPDILSSGGWRSWLAVPIAVALLWVFAREMWTVLRRQNGRPEATGRSDDLAA